MKIITCSYCRFYEPIDELKGDCFGKIVMANQPAEKCPTFEPNFSDFLLDSSDINTQFLAKPVFH
jgi:hypothetical protein